MSDSQKYEIAAMTRNGFTLAHEIIQRSFSDTWAEAKTEWKLDNISFANEPQRCLCSHFPIMELCEITNVLNGARVTVGNCCVKKFLGLGSDKIFQSIKRVRENPDSSLNAEAVDYAIGKGLMTEWEKEFYLDTIRKRKLSPKQWEKRRQINVKLVQKIMKPCTSTQ